MSAAGHGLARLACAVAVPAIRFHVTGGALLSATYFPLIWIARPVFGYLLLALSLTLWLILNTAPGLPGLLIFKWALFALVLILGCTRRLVDTGAPGTLRARFFERHGALLRRVCLLVGGLLLSLLLFRTIPFDLPLRYGITLLLAGWGLPPASHSSWSTKAMATALFGASAVMAIILCEAGARVLFKPHMPSQSFFEPHPVYWLMPKPFAVAPIMRPPDPDESGPQTTTVRISSQGIRDREYPPKVDDEFRVLLLGDSFVMGWGVEELDMPSRQLEAVLRERNLNRRVTVINGGVSGYGPWQARGLLHERGFPLQPDLVILQLMMGNDVQDTLRRVDKVLPAYSAESEAIWRIHRENQRWEVRLDGWMWRHSRLYQRFMTSTGIYLGIARSLGSMRVLPLLQNPALPESLDRPWFLEYYLRDWYPLLDEGWNLLTEDVLAIHGDCHARDVDFIVYAQPNVFGVADRYWRRLCRHLNVDRSLYDKTKGTAVPEQFFAEHDLPYIPVAEQFRKASDPESYFYAYDGHLTPKGCRAWAEIVAEYLVTEYFPRRGLVGP